MIDLNDIALPRIPSKCRVTLLALGDVGSTLLTGLRLMGSDVIGSIGICDVRPGVSERWEFELNQIQSPDGAALPRWTSSRRSSCSTATCSCSAPPG